MSTVPLGKIGRQTTFDHTCAPLVEALRVYHDRHMLPFTTPGHKCGRGVDPEARATLGMEAFVGDVSVGGGIDDTHQTRDLLRRAERLAADAFGAEHSYFLLNGSSLSNQIALLSVVGPGDEVVVARNAHKSVQTALVLSGARPVYVRPSLDTDLEVAHGVTVQALRATLHAHPCAKAAVIVSPTYFGVCADVRALSDLCYERGLSLIVDEAWAPHFPFHPALPPSAMACGADIGVASIHKVLSGFTQSSILNLQGDRVDAARVVTWVGLLQTTRPSAFILASIDACRRQMALHGRALLTRTLALGAYAHAAINRIPGLRTLGPEVLGRPGAVARDPTKLVIDVRGLGLSGYAAEAWLRQHRHIAVEMSDHRRVVALLTIADDTRTVDCLIDALRALAAAAPGTTAGRAALLCDPGALETESVLTPREAVFAPARHVPLATAGGAIAADTITPYPPAIPILAPGERITEPIVAYLHASLATGMHVTGIADPMQPLLRVVR
jgi:arginine decarboxylase